MLHKDVTLMNMKRRVLCAIALSFACGPLWGAVGDAAFISQGRTADPTAKVLSEIREAERRRIPIDAAIKARSRYQLSEPLAVTITVTNLFDAPLLVNSRLLVNHRLLPGELSFSVVDPEGKRCEFQRLVSPFSLADDDFLLLARGMSVQRTVDLADFFTMRKKGIYKVQVSYRNSIDQIVNGHHSWMGSASSDVTEIELQ